LKVVLAGLGVQGRKRLRVAGADVVATVDPVAPEAGYRNLGAVPESAYEAALLCVPDGEKLALLEHLLSRGKHVLVEKPLVGIDRTSLERLKALSQAKRVVCYTAYNHRFEPHLVRLKKVLDEGSLGAVYTARFFYGNGTARDVASSPWRDKGHGVLADLGSHLLDTIAFLFGTVPTAPRLYAAHRFENRAPDHVHFGFEGTPAVDCEATLLSWRNTFRADLIGEEGSAHVESLCKWGPSVFTLRRRVLPSGRPDEEAVTLVCADPTWKSEYEHFLALCTNPSTNLDTDMWINTVIEALGAEAGSTLR
jgi:predicted dehydrogenase